MGVPKMPEGTVSEAEAARQLKVNRSTLAFWRRSGWLRDAVLFPTDRTGRQVVAYVVAELGSATVLREDAVAFLRPRFVMPSTDLERLAVTHEDLGDGDVQVAIAEAVAVSVTSRSNSDIIQVDPETASFGDVATPGVLVDEWATGRPAFGADASSVPDIASYGPKEDK